MNTKIIKKGDTIIVSMNGRLDFETQEPLKNDLRRIMDQTQKTDSVPKKVIFDLQNLEFVGSSGISSFVQTLKDFNHHSPSRPKYCNVKSEFKKVMKAFDENDTFEFWENDDRGKKQLDQ